MDIYHLRRGVSPVLVSIPHSGTLLTAGLGSRMTPLARTLPDTDWHLNQLYGFTEELDCTILRANYSRYVIDLNRPEDDTSLYPGRFGTGLCPEHTGDGEPLYYPGEEPDDAETGRRIRQYWRPYHECLESEIERIRNAHGFAVLYDCHSIRSQVPRLFEGELPLFNLGSGQGTTCDTELEQRIAGFLERQAESFVVNGRFQGGYITRRYGDPGNQVHALQMEIAQRAYMDESAEVSFIERRAAPTIDILRALFDLLLRFRPGQAAIA